MKRVRIHLLIYNNPPSMKQSFGFEPGQLEIELRPNPNGRFSLLVFSPEGSPLRPIPGDNCNMTIEDVGSDITLVEFDMEKIE